MRCSESVVWSRLGLWFVVVLIFKFEAPVTATREGPLSGEASGGLGVVLGRSPSSHFGHSLALQPANRLQNRPQYALTYPRALYGYFGLVRLTRLGHDVSWTKA
jgi:hypothetical protein